MMYTRVYADGTGQTHFEDIEVGLTETTFAPPAPPVNLSAFGPAVRYAFASFPAGWHGDWHPTPRRQFLIGLSGEAAVQVGDGQVRHFGIGSLLLVEDTSGKGHVSWVVSETPVLSAIVQLPD